MGEKKRREANKTDYEKLIDRLIKELANQGCVIEVGWLGLRKVWVNPEAPQEQVDELRMAFMAGAQHLFSSIMGSLDPDKEPTEGDMKRMDLIDKELRKFYDEFLTNIMPTKGNA